MIPDYRDCTVSILVSYFSSSHNKVVVEHLATISLFRVSSETLFEEIVKLFQNYNIPWNNFVSVLMDSCNVIWGSKSGLEAEFEKKHPICLILMAILVITFTIRQRNSANLLKGMLKNICYVNGFK